MKIIDLAPIVIVSVINGEKKLNKINKLKTVVYFFIMVTFYYIIYDKIHYDT